MGCRFEAHPTRELAQLIAANNQLPGLAIHMAQPSLSGNDTIEAARFYRTVDETAFTN